MRRIIALRKLLKRKIYLFCENLQNMKKTKLVTSRMQLFHMLKSDLN